MAAQPFHDAPTGAAAASPPGRWADLGSAREWIRDIGIAIALNVWLGVLGPFGAFRTTPIGLRIACYLSMCLVAVIVYGAAGRLAAAWGQRRGVSPWLTVTLANLVVSAPMSRFVAFMVPLFVPRARFAVSDLDWYLQCVILMVPVGWVYLAAGEVTSRLGRDHAEAQTPAANATDAAPRLLARLPERLRGDVLALQAEDHYVRIHTTKGSDLVLMRLGDAIAELDGMVGVRAHRSWWVTLTAVREAVSPGRGMRLRLVNGLEAPVARDAVATVRRALAV